MQGKPETGMQNSRRPRTSPFTWYFHPPLLGTSTPLYLGLHPPFTWDFTPLYLGLHPLYLGPPPPLLGTFTPFTILFLSDLLQLGSQRL